MNDIQKAQIYLNTARMNIERIKELSAQSGIAYCCLGKLEKRQAELEYALYGNRNVSRGTLTGNLGFVLPAIGVGWWVAGGIMAAITAAGGIGAFLWHRDATQAANDNAEANLIRAQIEQKLINKGLNPNEFLPPIVPIVEEKSATEKIVDVVTIALIIVGVGLAFGIYKGFGKKT